MSEERIPIAIRVLAPLSLMALIFYLSAQPDLSSGLGVWDLIGRKIIHMAEYGVLTLLWLWALRPSMENPLPAAVVVAIAYAASDEYHQSFVGGRNGTPVDVVIDGVGVGLAALWARTRGLG